MMTTQTISVGNVSDLVYPKKHENADLTFFDPPYNIGIDYGDDEILNDKRPDDEYLADFSKWIHTAKHMTRPGGIVACLISDEYASNVDLLFQHHFGKEQRVNRIIWRERFAQYQESKFVNEHRHLFFYRKPGGDAYWYNGAEIRVPSARMILGDKRAKGPRVPGDVWECPRLPGNAKARVDWHPCQLHPEPLKRIVYSFVPPNGKVNELFAGSGSLAIVCKQLGLNYWGVDGSRKFVREALQRLGEE